MTKIIFEGWEVGMRKIPFTMLLKEKAGISLKDAKKFKDKLVDENEIFEIEIEDENLAKEILQEARRLGVKCRAFQ